jgi:hypothetical protein
MATQQRKYSKEEVARRGDEIYRRDIRAQVEPHRNGEIVAIDVESGAWEIDPDQITAAHRLEERYPDATVWVVRAGSRYLTRFGAGRSKK